MINKEKLENEKWKLNSLVKEALENGKPLSQNDAIIMYSRKVDALVIKAQREKNRHGKNPKER